MKLTISQSVFASVLAKGCAAAPKVTVAPILRHARLIAQKGQIGVSTCDLAMQVESSANAEVEQEGETTVNATKLKATVDRLPKSAVISLSLNEDGSELLLKAGRSRIKMPTLPVSDFPALDTAHDLEAVTFELTGAEIEKLLTRPLLAAAKNHAQSYFNSVYLHCREWAGQQALCAIGTDGYILMLTAIAVPSGAEGMPVIFGPMPGVLLDPNLAATALHLFKSATNVQVTVSKYQIIWTADGDTVSAKLIDSSYPDYRQIFSSDKASGTIVIDRESAASGVALVETFIDQAAGTRIEMAPASNGGMVMATASNGESRTVVDAETTGEVSFFAMRHSHLKTMLGAFKTDTLKMEFSSSERGKPVRFGTDQDATAVGAIALMATNGQWVADAANE